MTLKFFGGYDVATDHYLLISKIRVPQKWCTFTEKCLRQEEIFRVHLLEDSSIKLVLSEEIRAKSDALTMQP